MTKKNQETLISRVMLMFVGCAIVCVLSYLYYLPQKMQPYVINNYRDTIELVAMCVSSVLFVLSLVYLVLSKKKDISNRIVTPGMLTILAFFTALFSFVIPLSGDRGTYSRVAMLATVFVFIAYTTYYFVNKIFAFQTVVCAMYFILIHLYGKYYTHHVNFSVKIALDHGVARMLFALVIVLVLLVAVLISRKNQQFKLWHTALLSMVPAGMLIVRFFVAEYVAAVSLVVLTLVFVAIIVLTKIFKK